MHEKLDQEEKVERETLGGDLQNQDLDVKNAENSTENVIQNAEQNNQTNDDQQRQTDVEMQVERKVEQSITKVEEDLGQDDYLINQNSGGLDAPLEDPKPEVKNENKDDNMEVEETPQQTETKEKEFEFRDDRQDDMGLLVEVEEDQMTERPNSGLNKQTDQTAEIYQKESIRHDRDYGNWSRNSRKEYQNDEDYEKTSSHKRKYSPIPAMPPRKTKISRDENANSIGGEGQGQGQGLRRTLSGEKTRFIPPSKYPKSRALKIMNFVRPFTNKSVQELLNQTGVVESFWMPSIKTHCFVIFETEEQADKTREAVYDVEWPKGGKRLVANFVPLEEAKEQIEAEGLSEEDVEKKSIRGGRGEFGLFGGFT
eukprot:TRINITY_DN3232_c0_g2_i2.p2 TRINITY_DN3232_c0_g2~~TRINITY_DN3232_c0_g2_i2.p2  ORF type:complete len:409 (-),score=104.11 TRINITY_DN3232_c0_g2_i2:91-1197(-)